MATDIVIPKIGMTMVEATIVTWLVPDGQEVAAGTPVLTIETEKSEVEVEAPATGVVQHGAGAGETLPAGAVIGRIAEPGERQETGDLGRPPLAAGGDGAAAVGSRVLASPNARRVARELGVDLAAVHGSGPGGRVVSEDVEAVAAQVTTLEPPAPPVTASPAAWFASRRLGVDLAGVVAADGRTITRRDVERAVMARPGMPASNGSSSGGRRRRMSSMRRTIAARMTASLSESAQLTLTVPVQMDAALALREQLKSAWGGAGRAVPSVNDLVLRATALALEEHPAMNARIEGDELVEDADVHLGVAVAVDDGLVVPVIRHANELPLAALAEVSRDLAARARTGDLGPDDYAGATFSVSNLGPEGVDSFTPILNAPNVGILGVGAVRDDTRWTDDGPTRVRRLTLSLTWDHRALDGVPAARFAASVKDRLEAPASLLQ